MSSGSTPNYSLSYPVPTDPVNVAGDIKNLADNVADFLTAPAFINNLAINGGSLVTSAVTANLFNTNATTLNIGGAATALNIGNASGRANFAGDVNVATGKSYKVNNVEVLTSTGLSSTIVSSMFSSPNFTGTPLSTTAAVDTNTTQIATTAYVIGQEYLKSATASSTYQPLDADLTAIAANTSNGILKRTAENTWTAITDNSANWDTAYTDRNKWDGGATGLTAETGRTSLGLGTMATETAASYALLASPTLTGVPAAPTASLGTNTTQIATTAFVISEVSASGGLPSQTSNSGKFLTTDGTSASWAVVDLSSKANIESPTFTGTVSVNNFTATGTVNIVSPTAEGSNGPRDITMSTAQPSGGLDGDVWLVYV